MDYDRKGAGIRAREFKTKRSEQTVMDFRKDGERIFEGALKRFREAENLKDKDDYVAALMTFAAKSWDTRAIRDVLIHVGRVLGHDKQVIAIDDRDSYQNLLEEIRQTMPRNLVDGEVMVRKPEVDENADDQAAD